MQRPQTSGPLRESLRSHHGITAPDIRLIRAPYRICPLGAHIDHQLGTVTAMAINRGVSLAFAPSGSPEVRLTSIDYPGEVRFHLDAVPPKRANDWGDYARGAAMALAKRHALKSGLSGVVRGELAEMGLSSSASVGLAYLLALESANDLNLPPQENIRLDQAIENEYLGLNNGILDQSAILLSQRDHLTVIDCRAFSENDNPAMAGSSVGDLPRGVRLLPKAAAMPPFSILIAESGITRAIVSTDYNRRVAECVEAARALLKSVGREHDLPRLGMVTPEEYDAHRGVLTGAPAKRAEHFFGEMRRVRLGCEAWAIGDLGAFGRLMTESGRSSITHYQCGCDPLVALYEILVRLPGVHGARFSGAGFRGCCIALVDPGAAHEIISRVTGEYAAAHPELAARARYLVCQGDDGARIL